MAVFQYPTGQTVKFAIGKKENLPEDCQRVELYMRSGDPRIYIVPITEIENSNENSFLNRITPVFEK